MNNQKLNSLAKLVKKTGSYKTKETPKKPEKIPSQEELQKTYKLNLKTLKVEKN